MAPLVLTYFDTPGSAEPIRWALELSNLEWEDKRISREEFMALKPTLPNGQVPVIEVDGFVLAQSMTILRYVGKMGGLYPTDPLDAAKCDSIIDCTTDLFVAVRPSMMEKDEEKKMAMRKDLMAEFIPKWLCNVAKHLDAAGGRYFVCDKLTVADILIARALLFMKTFDHMDSALVDAHPILVTHCKTVSSEPKIAAFIAKHEK